MNKFYLKFLSREIDTKLCQRFSKTCIYYYMWYRNQSLKRS